MPVVHNVPPAGHNRPATSLHVPAMFKRTTNISDTALTLNPQWRTPLIPQHLTDLSLKLQIQIPWRYILSYILIWLTHSFHCRFKDFESADNRLNNYTVIPVDSVFCFCEASEGACKHACVCEQIVLQIDRCDWKTNLLKSTNVVSPKSACIALY